MRAAGFLCADDRETQLAFFRATATGFDAARKPDAPRIDASDPCARDAVLITSEAATSALCNGTLSFDRAHAAGLLAIDADGKRARRLRTALDTAFPAAAFSRFVCA